MLLLVACGEDTPAGQDATGPVDAIDAPPGCACTYGSPSPEATVANADARELSGLAASRAHANVFWTHNDSGDSARLFATDIDGGTAGTLSITGATANDTATPGASM